MTYGVFFVLAAILFAGIALVFVSKGGCCGRSSDDSCEPLGGGQVCGRCGHMHTGPAQFCGHCGEKLDELES